MRIFVAGATGVLGRRIVSTCAARGHEVVGLTRDDAGDELVRERDGMPYRGDVFDPDSLVAGARESDVIVHAATAIPTDMSPSASAWEMNDRVRREGARNLVETADAVDADRFVQQSVVWLARRPDGSSFDETAEPRPDRSTQSALDAERIVERGAETHGYESVVLRGGYFYAADAAHTRQFGERLLARRLPILSRGVLGRRDAILSFLHADDAGRAFADAIEGDATGCYHVVDDEPEAYATFVRALADRLDAPSPRRVPAWLAGLFVDDSVVRLLTLAMPTSNERFRRAFDWEPEFPTYRTGLDRVVRRWGDEGRLRPTADGVEWNEA